MMNEPPTLNYSTPKVQPVSPEFAQRVHRRLTTLTSVLFGVSAFVVFAVFLVLLTIRQDAWVSPLISSLMIVAVVVACCWIQYRMTVSGAYWASIAMISVSVVIAVLAAYVTAMALMLALTERGGLFALIIGIVFAATALACANNALNAWRWSKCLRYENWVVQSKTNQSDSKTLRE